MLGSEKQQADESARLTQPYSEYGESMQAVVVARSGSARSLFTLLLTMRPYSWINVVLIGVVAHVITTGSVSASSGLVLSGGLSLLLWFAGSGITEFFRKRYEYGESALEYLLLVPVYILIQVLVGFNTLTVVSLALVLGSCVLYGAKTTSALGRVSFLFRGFSEVGLFLLIASIHGTTSISPQIVEFAAVIYLITCSRNMTGDLRDVSVDTYTLPVVSQRLGQAAAVGLGLLAIAVRPELGTMFPIVVAVCLTGLCGLSDPYHVHRLYVLCTLFFITNYLVGLLGGPFVLSNIVFLGVLLDHTYDYTPRKITKLSDEESGVDSQ